MYERLQSQPLQIHINLSISIVSECMYVSFLKADNTLSAKPSATDPVSISSAGSFC